MTTISIVLAEDHALVREGTRQILDRYPDLRVVGEAGDGSEALALIRRLQPDVAILDIRMPGLNAVAVTEQARSVSPHTRVLILTAYDDDDFVLAALEAGARGYLLKTARATELLQAVRTVHAGGMVLDPGVAGRMAGPITRRQQGTQAAGAVESLTPRELEVLQLAARGLRNREIAAELQVSTRTVEGHFSSILSKLGVPSRTAAVMMAYSRQWLPETGDR